MNDDLKSVREETHFKIVFSDPAELILWEKWCSDNNGSYDYDKENSCQRGKFPVVEIFKQEVCWCDLMEYYLLHVAGYSYHSSIHPYKGEVFVRE
jgi:hypothetical protein